MPGQVVIPQSAAHMKSMALEATSQLQKALPQGVYPIVILYDSATNGYYRANSKGFPDSLVGRILRGAGEGL